MSVFDKFSGIGVASGFKLQAKTPLDPRQVVDTIDDRNALITENGAYEGIRVYVKADKKTYVLTDLTAGTWEELGAGGGGLTDIEQTKGNSTTAVMSQKATTDELNALLDLINDLTSMCGKTYVKQFNKADFTQLGTEQKYYITITKTEHGLNNAYVGKMLVNYTESGEDTADYQTAVVFEEKTLSTGTIKVYITIDLSQYTEYSGKIYLRGE